MRYQGFKLIGSLQSHLIRVTQTFQLLYNTWRLSFKLEINKINQIKTQTQYVYLRHHHKISTLSYLFSTASHYLNYVLHSKGLARLKKCGEKPFLLLKLCKGLASGMDSVQDLIKFLIQANIVI